MRSNICLCFILDIMGVVIQDNGVTEIVTKSTGRPVSKEFRLHIH